MSDTLSVCRDSRSTQLTLELNWMSHDKLTEPLIKWRRYSVPSAVADAPLRNPRCYWHLYAHELESWRIRYRGWY